MGRKAGSGTNKREEILAVAQECFMEQGFDGTSVRDIMKKVGAENGLFYYYFKNKDEAFDRVLDRFFARYEAEAVRIVEHGKRNPCRIMEDFFSYMEQETAIFRAKYAAKMHRTVRWAIREHTLTIIEPYICKVVDIQSKYYGIPPALAPNMAALYLTHGVGSAILHEDSKRYFANRTELKRGVSLLMGMPAEEQNLRIPYPAEERDVPGWMELVRRLRENFPGLDEEKYEKELHGRIADGEAWVFRNKGKIAAAVLYSKERCEVDFLAVLPDYHRRGLARKLLETVAAQFEVGTKLTVVTYRDEDSLGMPARAFYEAMGFTSNEKLMVFDYPCQRLSAVVTEEPLGLQH